MKAAEEKHGGMRSSPDEMNKLKKHARRSGLLVLAGVILVVVVGYVEDDPIIAPFIMIVVGLGWFIRTKVRMRSLEPAPR